MSAASGLDVVGGPLETSLEDSLFKGWEALDYFGREGTLLDGDVPDEEGGDGEAETGRGEGAAAEEGEEGEGRAGGGGGGEDGAAEAAAVAEGGGGRAVTDPPDEAVRAGVEAAAARAKPKSTGLHLRKTSRPAAAAAAAGSGAAEGDEVERTMAEIHAAEVWDDKPNWFFLQVKPSCEKSCSISISNMARSLEHVDIREVLVPTTQTMRLAKSGKSVKKEERLFPGYILVNMVMDRQTYNDVRQVTNIQWFMNDPNREKPKDAPFRPPIPVSVEEMRGIFARIRDAESAVPEVKTQFRPGDLVRVASGAHTGSEGTVVEVKPDLDTITTTLVVFGHETPVELQLNQVELVTSAAELNPPKKRGRKARAALEADAREAALSDRPAPVLIPVDPDGDVRGDGDGDDDSDSDSGDDECGDLDVDGDDGDHDGFEEAETE